MTSEQFASFLSSDTRSPESAMEMAATLLVDMVDVAGGTANLQVVPIAHKHAAVFQSAGAHENAASLTLEELAVMVRLPVEAQNA